MSLPVRHGIAFHTARTVIGFTLLAGLLLMAVIGYVAFERTRDEAGKRLQGLIDTVASTASAACFVEDKTLAKDIAQGLLKNSIVETVVIVATGSELTHLSRSERRLDADQLAAQGAISRAIYSPFDASHQVGRIVIAPNAAELQRLNREELVFIGSVMLFLLLSITLAAIYAAFRWIVLPMKDMSDRLHAMSAGDRRALLPVPEGHATTEIGRLVSDINDLTGHLGEAREQAERASRAKGDFLANMSHEIRTPINAVVGLAHLALKTGLTAKQRDYLEKISVAGSHLLDLVNDVLDVAKIEAGKLSLDPQPFSLQQTIERLADIAALRAAEKGLALHVDIAPDMPPCLIGDAVRIGQILINYLNNAIKFTEQGEIRLAASLLSQDGEQCRIRLAVSDTGIGLSQAQQARLFASFEQADVSTTRKFGGTGLGLAISKELAGMMGGEVAVDSVPGQGSTFSVELTLQRAAPGVEPLAAPAEATANPALGALAGLRVLLADDNRINQQIACELLEEHGVSVLLADNGRQVLALLEQYPVDCVLMDMRMPELDGLEATRCIRRQAQWANLPVIAMTANARTEDRDDCFAAGMNDFITKPVDPALFFRVVARWIQPGAPPAAGPADVAPSPEASGLAIDTACIGRLVRNDSAKMIRFAEQFLQSTRRGLQDIEQALADEQLDHLAQLGHRYKSSSASMGAAPFAATLRALEAAALDGDASAAHSLLPTLQTQWAAIESELADFLGGLKSA